MRVGQNPARFVEKVAQPAQITVAVVNCIPFLEGYYAQSLEVLKAVVESLHATREVAHPYDVMLFDNNSCAEVQDYLVKARQENKIQYLVLSDTNIGKIGAWNYMFGAAQGRYIVFSDGDILFRPGWLTSSLELFETFPNVGMVTARPLRTPMQFSSATLEWAESQPGVLEKKACLDWDTFREHTQSLGRSEEDSRKDFDEGIDYRLSFNGRTAFIGATHFQFMAPASLLKEIIPLPSEQPMRGERALDVAVNGKGYLRLTTLKPLVQHMGNTLPGSISEVQVSSTHKPLWKRFLWLPGVRHVLLAIHNRIFRLYFLNSR